MKYLIDGYKKQVGSLANQYKNLRVGDEFRIFDTDYCNIDGFDFLETSRIVRNGDGLKNVNVDDKDARRFKFTTDFETALDWCDCYCNFENIPYFLFNEGNTTNAEKRVNEMLLHIEMAKEKNKKIYLGNRFSDEFNDVVKNYPNCINKIITKDDLNAILDYGSLFETDLNNVFFNVTMIVGTGSSSGKFSCALQVKKHYEDAGEKVVLIHTEETFPFLDDQNGTIKGFCRNFSDLSTDEDLVYFQCLISKIYSEQKPDRIIFVTQAGVGIHGVIGSYQNTPSGKKMKGVWDSFITQSFGLNTVIITGNYDNVQTIESLLRYYNIKKAFIDGIFISPISFGEQRIKRNVDDEHYYTIMDRGDSFSVQMMAQGLALRYPNVSIYCNYDDISDKVLDFKKSDNFLPAVASLYAQDIIDTLFFMLEKEHFPNLMNELETKTENYKEVDPDQFKKATEIIRNLKEANA